MSDFIEQHLIFELLKPLEHVESRRGVPIRHHETFGTRREVALYLKASEGEEET